MLYDVSSRRLRGTARLDFHKSQSSGAPLVGHYLTRPSPTRFCERLVGFITETLGNGTVEFGCAEPHRPVPTAINFGEFFDRLTCVTALTSRKKRTGKLASGQHSTSSSCSRHGPSKTDATPAAVPATLLSYPARFSVQECRETRRSVFSEARADATLPQY